MSQVYAKGKCDFIAGRLWACVRSLTMLRAFGCMSDFSQSCDGKTVRRDYGSRWLRNFVFHEDLAPKEQSKLRAILEHVKEYSGARISFQHSKISFIYYCISIEGNSYQIELAENKIYDLLSRNGPTREIHEKIGFLLGMTPGVFDVHFKNLKNRTLAELVTANPDLEFRIIKTNDYSIGKFRICSKSLAKHDLLSDITYNE